MGGWAHSRRVGPVVVVLFFGRFEWSFGVLCCLVMATRESRCRSSHCADGRHGVEVEWCKNELESQ
jgi:hypothetical protein